MPKDKNASAEKSLCETFPQRRKDFLEGIQDTENASPICIQKSVYETAVGLTNCPARVILIQTQHRGHAVSIPEGAGRVFPDRDDLRSFCAPPWGAFFVGKERRNPLWNKLAAERRR